MGQTNSKIDYSSIEEEQWYLRYLNGKPKASLFVNETKYHVPELPLTRLEINSIVRDTIGEHEILITFTNDTGMDIKNA